MILEMKRALEDIKSGDRQGYRKIFDATYEEVYCRSFLILQKDEKAMDFTRGFFTEIFGVLDEVYGTPDQEKWFWQKYYQRMRKQYHKLLAEQETRPAGSARTLAEVPAALPLLHRIMLLMSYQDEFSAAEISGIFGLAEDKIQAELEKLKKVLPALTKNQPESAAAYLASWRGLLQGACRQIAGAGSVEKADKLYREAAADAGIVVQEEKKENFEYFVADVDLSSVKPKKKPVPVVEEEPEEEDEYDDEEDDEYDEYDDDDDDEEDDDRYDWDLEDDGRKMMIIGIVLALVLALGFGIIGYKFLTRDKGSEGENIQTEESEEDADAELIIKGDAPGEGDEEEDVEEQPAEEPEEVPEEEPAEPEEPEEPQTVVMKVTASSSRVRSEASTSSSVVTSVTNGEKVEVLSDTSQEWVQIRCIEQNNEEGYMMSQYLTAAE